MGWRHDDYECKSCGHVFEEMTKDDSAVPCMSCQGETVRLIGAPSLDWRHMGLDPGFPGAYAKWGKEKTKHHHTDKGSYHKGKAPNLSMY